MSLIVPVSYAVQDERSSPRVAAAFAAGCGGQATGENVLVGGPERPVALFGSPARRDLLTQAQREGRTWYYADHAFYRRSVYFRISRNRYQALVTPAMVHAWMQERCEREHVPVRHLGPTARFTQTHVDVAPEWRESGSAIVICPNGREYMSWFGVDAKQWTIDVVTQLSQLTDRPIVIRWKSNSVSRPLYLDLHDAYAVVVFSSNSAVEALRAGVPAITLAPWATTAPWASNSLTQINSLYLPPNRDRLAFLWYLAERQWTLDEIRLGMAWRWFEQQTEESI
jgi:hypothetical protein